MRVWSLNSQAEKYIVSTSSVIENPLQRWFSAAHASARDSGSAAKLEQITLCLLTRSTHALRIFPLLGEIITIPDGRSSVLSHSKPASMIDTLALL